MHATLTYRTHLHHLIYTMKYYITSLVVDCSHICFPFLEKGLHILSSAVPSRAFCGSSTLPYPVKVRLHDMSHFDQRNVHGGDTQHVQESVCASTDPPLSLCPK